MVKLVELKDIVWGNRYGRGKVGKINHRYV